MKPDPDLQERARAHKFGAEVEAQLKREPQTKAKIDAEVARQPADRNYEFLDDADRASGVGWGDPYATRPQPAATWKEILWAVLFFVAAIAALVAVWWFAG